MYGREIDRAGQPLILEFGHTGVLYERAFVLYDHQTQSLWLQATGRAEHGPLEGSQLPLLPSLVTTWEQWRAAHPETTVLPGERGWFLMSFRDFDGAAGRGDLGLVVTIGEAARLYPLRAHDAAGDAHVLQDWIGATPVVVFVSHADGTAAAWDRTVDSEVLHFDVVGTRLRDRETGSLWSPLTGFAESGPRRGVRLNSLAQHTLHEDRFVVFFPDGTVSGTVSE